MFTAFIGLADEVDGVPMLAVRSVVVTDITAARRYADSIGGTLVKMRPARPGEQGVIAAV